MERRPGGLAQPWPRNSDVERVMSTVPRYRARADRRADMKPASSNLVRGCLTAQLLDGGWLITCGSRWGVLGRLRAGHRENCSRSCLAAGPRHPHLTRLLDRLSGRNALRYQDQLATMLSAQEQLRPESALRIFTPSTASVRARGDWQAMKTAAIPVCATISRFRRSSRDRIRRRRRIDLAARHHPAALQRRQLSIFSIPPARRCSAPAHRLLGWGARASAAMDTGARQAARAVGSQPLCRRNGDERDDKAVRVVPHPVPVEDHDQADARAQ